MTKVNIVILTYCKNWYIRNLYI